jgi:Tol biopolymer transport system component
MKHARLLLPAVLVPLFACQSPDGSANPDMLAPLTARQLADEWGPALRIAGSADLHTAFVEGCPAESPDGRSLYFASNRAGDIDIYVSHREADGSWGDPELLPKGVNMVNSSANDFCPTPLPGGRLMFVSERNDGQNCGVGTADIYETQYAAGDGWLAPTHLGCVVNSAANEFAPSYVAAGGGMLFFSSNRAGLSGRHGIWVSRRGPDGEWQEPTLVTELSPAGSDAFRPNVSQDGRMIVFDSNRPGSAGLDIWYATRQTPNSTWSAPARFSASGASPINSAANETRAWLSRDGRRLYFGSNRDGVSFDVFVAARR